MNRFILTIHHATFSPACPPPLAFCDSCLFLLGGLALDFEIQPDTRHSARTINASPSPLGLARRRASQLGGLLVRRSRSCVQPAQPHLLLAPQSVKPSYHMALPRADRIPISLG